MASSPKYLCSFIISARSYYENSKKRIFYTFRNTFFNKTIDIDFINVILKINGGADVCINWIYYKKTYI